MRNENDNSHRENTFHNGISQLYNSKQHQQTVKAAKMTMELIQILEKTVSSGEIKISSSVKTRVKIPGKCAQNDEKKALLGKVRHCEKFKDVKSA